MTYYCTVKKEGTVYYVAFPDLPHVFTFGNTEKEALETARGISIPPPVFHSEYAVEVEPQIAFALMLCKKRGDKTQSDTTDKLNIPYQQYQQAEKQVEY